MAPGMSQRSYSYQTIDAANQSTAQTEDPLDDNQLTDEEFRPVAYKENLKSRWPTTLGTNWMIIGFIGLLTIVGLLAAKNFNDLHLDQPYRTMLEEPQSVHSSPIHILFCHIQLNPDKPMDILLLNHSMLDISTQSKRHIVYHILLDEKTYIDWLPSEADFTDNLTNRTSGIADSDLLHPPDKQSPSFIRTMSTLRSMLPWLDDETNHLSIVPYSWTRSLNTPVPSNLDVLDTVKTQTIGQQIELFCNHVRFYNCERQPTGVYLLKTMLSTILPVWVDGVIVLDTDLRVEGDIGDMWAYLDNMRATEPSALIAMTPEQSTSYLLRYPQLQGLGFNGGVQLQDLKALRSLELGSSGNLYHHLLPRTDVSTVFKHEMLNLGDQNVYTVMNVTAPQLYYRLPCEWNRQLCTYWYHPDRQLDVDTFSCNKRWRIVHANCPPHKNQQQIGDDWRNWHAQYRYYPEMHFPENHTWFIQPLGDHGH